MGFDAVDVVPLEVEHSSIEDGGVESIKCSSAFDKSDNGVLVAHVELPYFDSGCWDIAARGDGFGGCFAFRDGADGEDDFGGVEADEKTSCFETKTCVGARDYYCLVGEVGVLLGDLDQELGVQEVEEVYHC